MPEDSDLDTKDLQEAIDELHEQQKERTEEERANRWTRYIGLSTAILAVFAAIATLQSGSLVNEAVIDEVKASDAWNEYQASREKTHLYDISINSLVDMEGHSSRTRNGPPRILEKGQTGAPRAGGRSLHSGDSGFTAKDQGRDWAPKSPAARASQYESEVSKESSKSKDLMSKAKALQAESERELRRHEAYAYSVALIQVAIALGAIAALAKVRYVWYLSLACGALGIGLFILGAFH